MTRTASSSCATRICEPAPAGSRSTSAGPANRRTTRSSRPSLACDGRGHVPGECLNQHRFMSLDDAVRKCEAWRGDYNEVRPHSAIGHKTPISLVNRSAAHGPLLPADAG
ncbi:integrase core domain-containing protein [Sphingomonas sp. 2R-10]|uniref:integrase core domain-containing protein n=1 Tax=Sphingomonas sp. 2R-10 TaxID=3045148 RepID=UPI003FA7CF13